MLREIYCEAFHQKTIRFTDKLNVVLGTPTGTNSIGKSTFMLIIDFVFGGNTYAEAEDILKNVKQHRICWTFEFGKTEYYFAREMPDSNHIEKCNKGYAPLTRMSVKEYCEWLRKQTDLVIEDLSFRDAVGRYIRAYGKENCSEKKPLQAYVKETDAKASIALLKLFEMYPPVSALQDRADKSEEDYKAYTQAQKLHFIAKIGKREYRSNEKEILKIEEEIEELADNLEHNILDVDAAASEKAIEIKKALSMAKRYRSSLLGRVADIDDNLDYPFSASSDTFKELARFFPDVNLAELSEVEAFHKKISGIFKQELIEENTRLRKEVSDYDSLIRTLENQMMQLFQTPRLSRIVLEEHAGKLKELDRMRGENEAYETVNDLKEQWNSDKQSLEDIKTKQFAILSDKVNNEMNRINNIIYKGGYNSPKIVFGGNTYQFFTPNDTGTGIAYKGLVVFDLAVLNLTHLPILVHDSVVLKQISDEAIERIMEQYIASNKQVVIALDKQESYSSRTTQILEENAVLRLASNGEELFGRFWGRNDKAK
jgi:hypothetical protein